MCSFLRLISIICIILGLSVKGVTAQPRYSNPEEFSVINGLPNNEVRCLLKDTKGYIWAGTLYGLAKYDGNKFTVFKHLTGLNSISGDVITAIFEDDKGNILVGANGLSILDRKTGHWENYLHNPDNKFTISNPSISSIAQENDSIYWIITYNGINRFNIKTGRFINLKFHPNSRILTSRILKIVPNKNILFSVSSSFYSYDLTNDTYRELPIDNNFEHNSITYFKSNILGIRHVESDKYKLIRYDLSSNQEYSLIAMNGGSCLLFQDDKTLYIAHKNKIYFFSAKFKLIDTIYFQPQITRSKIEYLCGLKEENGTIWIGSTNGLYKILSSSPFHILDNNNGLPNEYIRSLCVDSNNNLWVGVKQGAIYKIPHVVNLLNKFTCIKNILYPNSNGVVYATNQIVELENRKLLCIAQNAIYLFNTTTREFTDQFQIPYNKQYFSALEIPNGVLIGSLEKPTLFKIVVASNRIKLDTSFRIKNIPDVVYTLYKDSENKVWLGGEGLFKLIFPKNSDSVTVETIIPPINEKNLTNNSVWNILEIDGDRLVVCTTTNGFYVYNKLTNSTRHFNKNNGLPTDFTCAVQKDINNNLWLSTKEGLSFINSRNFNIQNYTIKNGPFNPDFNFKSCARTNTNLLLFGSKQGIVYFNPDSIKQDKSTYPLRINEFRVFDNVVKRELSDKDTIVLKHDENFFSFEFSLLDFRNPKENYYKYQLLKYDLVERVTRDGVNSVSYTDVPPGRYIFRLTAFNSANLKSKQKIETILIIKPAYYQTLLFRIFIAVFILAIAASILLIFIRRQILRGRLYKMELDLLRAQINPHFIFNTLTSIQHNILMNSKDIASENLSKFSRLMRMCLDYSRLEYIPLEKAINFYKTYVSVESVNLDEEIYFQVTIDKAIDSQRTLISPMHIQPFIENAIVHGLTPKNNNMYLELTFNKAEDLLICTIKDNGIGRVKASDIAKKKANGYQSIGIELTKKSILLQLQKRVLIKDAVKIIDNYDEYGIPLGTTVILKILYRL